MMRALGRCGASWRGSPEARGARPGASLWHVWMALPKPEWIDPHWPITVEIAKLVNPHRALVSANINLLATGNLPKVKAAKAAGLTEMAQTRGPELTVA